LRVGRGSKSKQTNSETEQNKMEKLETSFWCELFRRSLTINAAISLMNKAITCGHISVAKYGANFYTYGNEVGHFFFQIKFRRTSERTQNTHHVHDIPPHILLRFCFSFISEFKALHCRHFWKFINKMLVYVYYLLILCTAKDLTPE
jgi:hypothetical protein